MTVKDFYSMLFGDFVLSEFNLFFGEHLSGTEAGGMPLERRTAAYMAYVYIMEINGETEEKSLEPAFVLKDIYECPSCIRYVAEVYLKGIMPGKNGIFGVREKVTEAEAEGIVGRIKNKSKRFCFSE